MKIAHTADIQIRFGTRHEEFETVFQRFNEDLKKQKPDRITVAGDLMHHKIRLSPQSIRLLAKFLFDLSKIAPTDVILGNHDLNLQQLNQGDALSPIFDLAQMMDVENKAITVTNENKEDIDYWHNAIYYYPDSGFYDIGKNVVYGIYSCKDNEVFSLSEPDPEKTYIALWHGTLYGSMGDNGYEIKTDGRFNADTFRNYDAVMMGDIHEYQTFRENETIAYCGSLIQNNFGESISKGYLLWDLKDKKNISHQRRFILNDWGFAKINISRGEKIEERIENIKFSNDRTKTKINVVIEDFKENYSLERERYIASLIKKKYGCKEVNVSFEVLDKEDIDLFEEEQELEEHNEDFINLFQEWLEMFEGDLSDEERSDLLNLALKIDNEEIELGEQLSEKKRTAIEPLKVTISNVFSFPEKSMVIDLKMYEGILGIFGKNYSGKSNLIRAIVWGLFETVPNNKDSNTIVNLYTKSNKGYVVIELLINGVRHRISRRIEYKENGSNPHKRKFEVWKEIEKDGELVMGWDPVKSDSDTNEQKEVKKLIAEKIGSYEDFSISSLHIHGSEDDYLSLAQQDKNTLFWKYNGLDPYKQRTAFGRKKLNTFKKDHKELGKTVELEQEIQNLTEEVKSKRITLDSLQKEKEAAQIKRDDANDKIIDLTSKIKEVKIMAYNSKEEIEERINDGKKKLDDVQKESSELSTWLESNKEVELSVDPSRTEEIVSNEIKRTENQLKVNETEISDLSSWVEENPQKEMIDDSGASEVIMKTQAEVIELQNDLILYQGKPCPTCGNHTEKPDPNKERNTRLNISDKTLIIEEKTTLIKESEKIKEHNRLWSQKETQLTGKQSQKEHLNERLKNLNKELEIVSSMGGVLIKNEEISKKRERSIELIDNKHKIERAIEKLQEQYDLFDDNENRKKENEKHEKYIQDVREVVNQYKTSLLAIDRQINEIMGNVQVIENNIKVNNETLDKIKEADRNFKLYSVYLQAVERDGIPSMIIKRRLPLINSRINSMVSQVANFKVELSVDKKGDIKEHFYFVDTGIDKLPVSGSGSGAQKFIISLAIKDALRYMSGKFVVQPTILLIDEGFGTLHHETLPKMVSILNYLKTKYKNLIVITHVDEIKDSADYIFEAYKDRSSISEEDLAVNENAGITKMLTR